MMSRQKLISFWLKENQFWVIQRFPIIKRRELKILGIIINTPRMLQTLVFLYFHFSYLYPIMMGNIIVYTPSQGTNKEKYF